MKRKESDLAGTRSPLASCETGYAKYRMTNKTNIICRRGTAAAVIAPTQTLHPTSQSTLVPPSCLLAGQSTPLVLETP